MKTEAQKERKRRNKRKNFLRSGKTVEEWRARCEKIREAHRRIELEKRDLIAVCRSAGDTRPEEAIRADYNMMRRAEKAEKEARHG